MSAVLSVTATHLSNQDYSICIRRNSGNCFICYTPAIDAGTPASGASNSFGLSLASAAIAVAKTNAACTGDYTAVSKNLNYTLYLEQNYTTTLDVKFYIPRPLKSSTIMKFLENSPNFFGLQPNN